MPTEHQYRSNHIGRGGQFPPRPERPPMEILTLVIQIVFPTTAVVLALMTMRLLKDWQ
jgi:hypothetical protein